MDVVQNIPQTVFNYASPVMFTILNPRICSRRQFHGFGNPVSDPAKPSQTNMPDSETGFGFGANKQGLSILLEVELAGAWRWGN